MRVALVEMLHPDAVPADDADPAGGRDRRGRRDAPRCSAAPTRRGSSTACSTRSSARCARMQARCSTPEDQLDALIGRLERAAEQLRSGELSADAAATLVEECAALATRGERRARAPRPRRRRGRADGRTPSCAAPRALDARPYPDHLREQVDATCARCASPTGATSPAWSRRCATRCSRRGKRIRPVLALATAIARSAASPTR